jgi:hypothetical protein
VCRHSSDDPFQYGLLRQRLLQFRVGLRDGRTRFLPGLLRTANTDRNLERAFEQLPNHDTRQSADDRQIRDQSRQVWAKLADYVVGQRRQGGAAARRTRTVIAAIFRDLRLDRRQFGHLVSAGIADRVARM